MRVNLLLLTLFLCFNLQAKVKTTATSHHAKHPPSNISDGVFTTHWQSQNKGPQTLSVDLGESQLIKGFVYIPFLNKIEGRVLDYSIEISPDGQTWEAILKGKFQSAQSVSLWTNAKDKLTRLKLPEPVKTRFYRLKILSTYKDFPARISEFSPFIDDEPFAGQTLAMLKGLRYAPSIHLSYRKSPKATVFYNEIEVTSSTPGSFFMAIGYNQGYFGIQESSQGKKWLLFSTWDSKDHDKNAQAIDLRVQVAHKDTKTRVQRFGHEGSGGQSFYDYDWKVGERIRFALKLDELKGRRHYSAYFFNNQQAQWIHMLTFTSVAPQKFLSGFHSFIEDFKRDYKSFNQLRSMKIHQTWVRDIKGDWFYAKQAFFTRDANPHGNISAFSDANSFNFGTGGHAQKPTEPKTWLKRDESSKPPNDFPF